MEQDTVSYAAPKMTSYREADVELPDSYWLWPLYGAGLENLGRDGQPIQVPLPPCGPENLLVRHDAVGLCFSDTKVIKAGEDHPRLSGRDMKENPVVLGHEVVLTVMEVGENYADRFNVGDRFIVQADIYYQGEGMAYGYALQGGLSQYSLIGKEILEGDGGCYLIPVAPETGYAQAALTEPWACVLASYNVNYRTAWKADGSVLIVAGPGALDDYTLGEPYVEDGPPARVIAVGVDGGLSEQLEALAKADGFELSVIDEVSDLDDAEQYDDIVLLGADADLYEALEPRLANEGLVNLVGTQALTERVSVDVGRLHYDDINVVGTTDTVIASGYEPIRVDLVPHGTCMFIGAAGPMGQMHFQRALQAEESPRLMVATSRVMERLKLLKPKFARMIEEKRDEVEVIVRAFGRRPTPEFDESLMALTDGEGYDDIVVLAPSAEVMADATTMLAPGGMISLFAGLPRGTLAKIDLASLVEKGWRFTGSSGSSIDDLGAMLDEAESGRLDPNLSVVAVAGLDHAKRGLEGLMHQEFPGKVVIYPQILNFPLTLLEELETLLPDVYAKLGPNHSWAVEAEAEFMRELLP
ncbi:MAG: zinc-binding dehydrogenase [Chloroflexota bacterium]|nr:zinc-binding dehydrogenase [Chloroflexota bacterium]